MKRAWPLLWLCVGLDLFGVLLGALLAAQLRHHNPALVLQAVRSSQRDCGCGFTGAKGLNNCPTVRAVDGGAFVSEPESAIRSPAF